MLTAAILAMAIVWTTPCSANQLFAFDYSLPGSGPTPMSVTASGYFATTDLSAGSYTITGVWGTWNGLEITGISDPGTFGNNDNLLNSTEPFFDGSGVSFTVDGSGDDGFGNVNLYYDLAQGGYTENGVGIGGSPVFHLSPATPIPVLFNFSYSIAGAGPTPMDVAASGRLTTYRSDADAYLVTDITGEWNGGAILGVLPEGTYGGNDNLISISDPHLTLNGLSYLVSGNGDDGSGNVNVFYALGAYTEVSNDVDFTPTFNLSQVPEPASTLLALGGIVLFIRRRR
jgi:hypothetical protein